MNGTRTGNAAIPARVGGSRAPFSAYLGALVVAVVGSAIATQLVAYRLADNPSLGHPLLRLPLAGGLYAPWAWASWAWKFANPFASLQYPAIVMGALATLPFTLGVTAAAALFAFVAISLRRPRADVSAIVDSAHLASRREMRAKGLLGTRAGPIIGGVRDFLGRIAPLRYSGRLGVSFTGPPDAQKTSSFGATNLLIRLQHEDAGEWTADARRKHFFGEEPTLVVVDPKGHLARATSGYQRDVLGKDVLVLEPLSLKGGRAAYNPLWSIRFGTPHEQYDCYRVAHDIVRVEGGQLKDYWDQAGAPFGAAMIGKLGYRSLYRNDPSLLSLPGLLDYLSSFSSIEKLVEDMEKTPDDPHRVFGWTDLFGLPTRVCPWIAGEARVMAGKAADEKSGVYGTFSAQLGIYRNAVMRPHIMRSTFTFAELANRKKPAVLYICVPGLEMDALSPYLRLVVKTALRELTQTTESIGGQEVRGNERSAIFLLDDFAALGRLQEVASSAGYLRGHGVALWLVWQATSQLATLYGRDETLSETLGVHITAAPRTHEPATDLSQALGQSSALLQKGNESGSRFSATPLGHLSEQNEVVTRSILTPSEIQSLGEDETIVQVDGLKIRARKFSFFKNEELRRRSEMAPPKTSDVLRTRPRYHETLEEALGPTRFARLFKEPPKDDRPPKDEAPAPKPKVPPSDVLGKLIAEVITRNPSLIEAAGKATKKRAAQ